MPEQNDKEIDRLFQTAAKYEASDLHLKVGAPPLLRLAGSLRPLEMKPLTDEDTRRLIEQILTPRQKGLLEKIGSHDFAYSLKDVGRFRVNVFRQRGAISLAARRVKTIIPTVEQLHLPPALLAIASYQQGLVIVSGVTGCGKSTTLAAMVEYVNTHERCHIVTIEDPIEYLFTDKKSYINQREIGIDVLDWRMALKYVVRQDPDVIVIGEMRDADTFEAGLMAAETGHLVFGSLHSSTVAQTFGRMLDFFPADMHHSIRQLLAFNLKAIVCQRLLPSCMATVDRVPAVEIMLTSPIVRKLIMNAEDAKLLDAIRASRDEGMQDFNRALAELVQKEFVSQQMALDASPNPDALKMLLRGIETEKGRILAD